MRKVPWSRLTLLRVIGISLLIIVAIYWGLKHNPMVISKIRKTVFPSDVASPQRWILESRKLHTICGHLESKRTEYHTEEPFKAVIKSYFKQVKRENNQSYTYLESDHDLCYSCRKNQFLGLDGRRIAVFRGTPGKPGPITEKIAIDLNQLPEAEVEDLKKGIPFQDGKEKLQLLEGLNSLSAE